MKPALAALPILALGLTACETAEQSTLAGAATGAAIGAAFSSDDDRTQGAVLGAAAGAAAGAIIGRTNDGQCVYRDAYGREYIAAC